MPQAYSLDLRQRVAALSRVAGRVMPLPRFSACRFLASSG